MHKKKLVDTFKYYMRVLGSDLPCPEAEFRFHPTRKWRHDFAYPSLKIAIELEGGVFKRGRHTRGVGYSNDCIKYNEAGLQGWLVLRFTVYHLDNDPAMMVEQVRRAIELRQEQHHV